jgi:hypothetical protein
MVAPIGIPAGSQQENRDSVGHLRAAQACRQGENKRRAELAGEIERTHEALRKMVLDLENLHATGFLFDGASEAMGTTLATLADARASSRAIRYKICVHGLTTGG